MKRSKKHELKQKAKRQRCFERAGREMPQCSPLEMLPLEIIEMIAERTGRNARAKLGQLNTHMREKLYANEKPWMSDARRLFCFVKDWKALATHTPEFSCVCGSWQCDRNNPVPRSCTNECVYCEGISFACREYATGEWITRCSEYHVSMARMAMLRKLSQIGVDEVFVRWFITMGESKGNLCEAIAVCQLPNERCTRYCYSHNDIGSAIKRVMRAQQMWESNEDEIPPLTILPLDGQETMNLMMYQRTIADFCRGKLHAKNLRGVYITHGVMLAQSPQGMRRVINSCINRKILPGNAFCENPRPYSPPTIFSAEMTAVFVEIWTRPKIPSKKEFGLFVFLMKWNIFEPVINEMLRTMGFRAFYKKFAARLCMKSLYKHHVRDKKLTYFVRYRTWVRSWDAIRTARRATDRATRALESAGFTLCEEYPQEKLPNKICYL